MTPPKLATWLLKRFGCSPNNEAVLGDLVERYAGGRSRAWYWKQVFVGIAVSAFDDIRAHKLLTLRDLAIALVFGQQSGVVLVQTLQLTTQNWTPAQLYPAVNSWIPIWTFAEFAEVFPYAIGTALGLVAAPFAGLVAGWIAAKIHHPYERSLLLLLHVTVAMLFVTVRLFGPSEYLAPGWLHWTAAALMMIGIFLGGLLKRTPKLASEAV